MFKYPLAVTIDTNIFDSAKYDLSDGSTIRLLENYVKNGTLKVVLSNIVVRESKKHLSKQVQKICSISRKLRTEVLKESTEHLVKHIGLDELLNIPRDKKTLEKKSEELFDIFLHEIDAEILNNDLIDLDKIIDDYFDINPPFEDGDKKRKEFPDAFIANQIIKRFGDNEVVAIVSNDKGFKKACQSFKNHLFFESLGELYDAINKEKEAYSETINAIKELQFRISDAISEHISQNENIDVIGLSYDRDGIAYGYDYDETYLEELEDTSFFVHSVDQISDETSIVTLNCSAKISVNCYYEDYDNAPWDSEKKEYVFVDTIKIREEHMARFACRIEINRESKEFNIFPFKVILGGDSRKNRYEIKEPLNVDYDEEIKEKDREYLGFIPLGSYKTYLEEDLSGSDMSQEIMKHFEKMNNIYLKFEDISIIYDSLLEEFEDENNIKKIIKAISKGLEHISDFPSVIDEDDIGKDELAEIQRWVECKSEQASIIADRYSLPDSIDYGKEFVVSGIDDSSIILSIDEINIKPSEGSEELIDISLFKDDEKIATGHIKLMVGYLDFDEDGGAANGLGDSIEYEYFEILERIKAYIGEQKRAFKNEEKIAEAIENALKK